MPGYADKFGSAAWKVGKRKPAKANYADKATSDEWEAGKPKGKPAPVVKPKAEELRIEEPKTDKPNANVMRKKTPPPVPRRLVLE